MSVEFSEVLELACDAWESAHYGMKSGMYRMVSRDRHPVPSPVCEEERSALICGYLEAQMSFLSLLRASLVLYRQTKRVSERDKENLERLSRLTSIGDTKNRAGNIIETLTTSSGREEGECARAVYIEAESEFYKRMVCALRGREIPDSGWDAAEEWARPYAENAPLLTRIQASLTRDLNAKRASDWDRDRVWMYPRDPDGSHVI